jgi:hypothetical protein
MLYDYIYMAFWKKSYGVGGSVFTSGWGSADYKEIP